jgi:hypothetical protein
MSRHGSAMASPVYLQQWTLPARPLSATDGSFGDGGSMSGLAESRHDGDESG